MIQVKVIVDGPYIPKFDTFVKEIEAECAAMAQDIKKSEEDVMANWVNKAQVTVTQKVEGGKTVFHIAPTGDKDKYWAWVSGGVKGHHISPRNFPFLQFKYQGPKVSYIPKTYPGQGWGGSGTYQGPKRKFFDGVDWPGIEARDFEGQIVTTYKPAFEIRINAAFERALAKAKASMAR